MLDAGRHEGPTLGRTLRERREARGLSQEQAAQQARVQLIFVRALEADDYRLLPDEMYLTRFVHEYAAFLGMEPAGAVETFLRQVRREGAAHPPLHREVPRLARLPWRRILWTAAAILPLIPLVFIGLSMLGREPEGPVRAPAAQEGETPGEGGEAEPAPADKSRHILLARAREVTWMAVRADDGPEREVLLREGETARWTAERELVLTIGNVGGVDVTLDGQPLTFPSHLGGVVRRVRLPLEQP